MTPEEHVATVEQAVAQGFERTIGGLKNDLKKAQEELQTANKELAALQTQNVAIRTETTRDLEDASQLVHKTVRGQWTDLATIFGGVVGGFVSGYFVQRAADVRAPFMAIGGALLAGFGALNSEWHLTTRAALVGGGATMILGSVVHVFVVSPSDTPTAQPPATQGAA